MDASKRITSALTQALSRMGITDAAPMLEFPAELVHGDFATNVAFIYSKQLGKNPRALAEEIVTALGSIEGVSKIEIAGPGFINFHLARDIFSQSVDAMLAAGASWGNNDHVKGYKVLVEYSQPNPFKPFHIGHLMSTTVGESISRLVAASGATLFRANYQGDVGPHVAKCLWGLEKEKLDPSNIDNLGTAYVRGNAAYEDSVEAKAEIDAINKRLYENDPSLKAIYDAGRAASLAHFEELYRVLGTRFDHYFFESETAPVGKAMVEEGLAKNIFERSDGAVVYRGEKHGLHTRVFITAHGTPTYEAKEIGLAQAKRAVFPFDLNITTVAIEQDGYFKVVEEALAELMPDMRGKYTHVSFGLLTLTTGKMSSRKGNVITGESLIADMREKALEKMGDRELGEQKDAVVDAVAVAAVKYAVLKQARGKNIVFDPEKSLSFEGDSGPYLQYAHTRALSVLARAGEKSGERVAPGTIPTFERLLPRFPAVVFRAAKESEPHYITTYLTELAGAFNAWYATERIIDSEHEQYKLALVAAFAQTMKNGLFLLGIDAPERM